jgi:hypothetical protein
VGIVKGWKSAAVELSRKVETTFVSTRLEATISVMQDIRESINGGEFQFSVSGKSGRIASNITQMPSVMRAYLTLDGCSELVAVDLSSSHLYFLLPLAREWDVPEAKVQELWDVLSADDIYENVGKILSSNYTSESRGAAKKQVTFALYSKNKVTAPVKDLLSIAFEDVWRFVYEMKERTSNKLFAILLQRIEADFVTKLVPNQLRQRGIPVWTVHDCFIVKQQHQREVERLIVAMGRDYTGFTPLFKTKPLTRWT